MSYEQDMYINENELEVELLEQPTLVAKYTRLLAGARKSRDLAKEALNLKKAEINLDIRDNPQDYKLEKITVDAVEACILMEDEYKEAQRELNETNFEVDLLQGIVNALDHRKSALEKLVTLYGQNYFAGPAIPHDIGDLRQKRLDEAEEQVNQGYVRRRITKPKSQTNDKKEK